MELEIRIKAIEEVSERLKTLEGAFGQFSQTMIKQQAGIQKSSIITGSTVLSMAKSFLGMVGAPLTIMGVVYAIRKAAIGTLDWAVQMRNMSLQMGLTIEQLQVFQRAATLSNTEFSGMRRIIFQLASVLDGVREGVEGAGAKFEKFGIDIKGIVKGGGDANMVLRAVSSTLRKMPDDIKRIEMIRELFGRYGLINMPILMEDLDALESELRDRGLIISEEVQKRLLEMEGSWSRFWDNTIKFWKKAGAELLVGLGGFTQQQQKFSRDLTLVVEAFERQGLRPVVSKSMEFIRAQEAAIVGAKDTISLLTTFRDELSKLAIVEGRRIEAAIEMGGRNREAEESFRMLQKVVSELAGTIVVLTEEQVKAIKAQKEITDAIDAEKKQTADLEETKKKIGKITEKHSDSIRAQLSLLEKQLSLTVKYIGTIGEMTGAYEILKEKIEEVRKAILKEDVQRQLERTLKLLDKPREQLKYLKDYIRDTSKFTEEELIKQKERIADLELTIRKQEVYDYIDAWERFATTISTQVSDALEKVIEQLIRGTRKIRLIFRDLYQSIIRDFYKEFIGGPIQMAIKDMLLGTGTRTGAQAGLFGTLMPGGLSGLFMKPTSAFTPPPISIGAQAGIIEAGSSALGGAKIPPGAVRTPGTEFSALSALGFAAGTTIAIGGVQRAGAGKKGGVGQAMAGGALAGASIGSVVPVIGTIVGGVIGAAIGGLTAVFKKGEYNKTKEREKARLWAEEYAKAMGEAQTLVTGARTGRGEGAVTAGQLPEVAAAIAEAERARVLAARNERRKKKNPWTFRK